MSRVQTLIQLNDELLARLDAEAADRGMSRSAVVRQAVEAHLAASRREQVDQAIRQGYQDRPQTDAELDIADRDRRRSWADLEW